jgi:hypothetical protein
MVYNKSKNTEFNYQLIEFDYTYGMHLIYIYINCNK